MWLWLCSLVCGWLARSPASVTRPRPVNKRRLRLGLRPRRQDARRPPLAHPGRLQAHAQATRSLFPPFSAVPCHLDSDAYVSETATVPTVPTVPTARTLDGASRANWTNRDDDGLVCWFVSELEAYASMVSVLRAQGHLREERRRLLEAVRAALHIGSDRHQAEARRVSNDELLAAIAEQSVICHSSNITRIPLHTPLAVERDLPRIFLYVRSKCVAQAKVILNRAPSLVDAGGTIPAIQWQSIFARLSLFYPILIRGRISRLERASVCLSVCVYERKRRSRAEPKLVNFFSTLCTLRAFVVCGRSANSRVCRRSCGESGSNLYRDDVERIIPFA